MLMSPMKFADQPRRPVQILIGAVVMIGDLLAAADAGSLTPVAELTSARTRVVWVQDQSPENDDSIALGRQLLLMAFDSTDGLGERPIVPVPGSYAKPLLTPDGQRVVYSDRYSRECFVINWDGTGRRRLGSGFAVDVWSDPVTGDTWVYAAIQVGALDSFNFRTVRRIRLDGGREWELVWKKTEISPDNFQLSADGTLAAGEFPWPIGGTADLGTQMVRRRADGCWASLAPDNSGLCWIFDGPHRNVYLYPRDSPHGWKVGMNTAPGLESHEVFHPRWSNHVRYFGLTGPYKVSTRVNAIAGGGPDVEVYVGRFSDDFRRVDGWAQITSNRRGDFHPDVWIQGGESSQIPPQIAAPPLPDVGLASDWPGDRSGLVFLWDNAEAQNIIAESRQGIRRVCRVEARGKARMERFFDMDCTGGSFVAEPTDTELLTALQRTNELTLEAAITPRIQDLSRSTRVISMASDASVRNFVLAQHGTQLTWEFRPERDSVSRSDPLPLAEVEAGRQQHLVLTYSAGTLVCYVDGQRVAEHQVMDGRFGDWTDLPLVFGDGQRGRAGWSGRLEAIAVYDRALTANDAAAHFELFSRRLPGRTPVNRWQVQATCLETSAVPDPVTIVPYRRALVVNRYRVDRVLSGVFEHQEILVAQWAILDRTVVLPDQVRTGQTLELTIEDFDQHPELKSERQVADVEGLELPWYYAIGQ